MASHGYPCADLTCRICYGPGSHHYGYHHPEPRPQKREMELLFDTEPIVGWRVWRIARTNDDLTNDTVLSLIADAIDQGDSGPIRDLRRFHLHPLAWQAGPWLGRQRFESECRRREDPSYFGIAARPKILPPEHGAPHATCTCGAWAVREMELPGAIQQYPKIRTKAVAVGEVYLWGHVVEETKGYRAQYAYPKSLIVVNGTEEMVEDLAYLYGVEVQSGEWQKEWTPKRVEPDWDSLVAQKMALYSHYQAEAPKKKRFGRDRRSR